MDTKNSHFGKIDSKMKKVWTILIFIATIYTAIYIPLTIVFQIKPRGIFLFADTILSVLYILDMIIISNTPYFEKMKLVTDHKKIMRKYLKKWFWFDILACIPFGVLFSFNDVIWALPLIQLLRMARTLKLIHSTANLKKITSVNPSILRMFYLILFVLIFGHIVACLWIVIGNITPKGETLIERKINHYIQSFYWTITTLTTVGYGDITPAKENGVQLTFVIIIELIGAAIYGFIIGNIANLIANIDIAKSQHKEKVDKMNSFLKYHNVTQELSLKVNDYYSYLWESRRGYEEKNVVNDLPTSLKSAVSIEINREMIKKVPLFQGASNAMIEEIILNLEPTIYTPQDYIVRAGDIGYDMFFIKRGSVDVISADNTKKYATLSDGQYFGEIALLLRTPRTAHIIANEYCDLYKLNKQIFDRILSRYPSFKKMIAKITEKRNQEMQAKKI